jgi:hypothetical protein
MIMFTIVQHFQNKKLVYHQQLTTAVAPEPVTATATETTGKKVEVRVVETKAADYSVTKLYQALDTNGPF